MHAVPAPHRQRPATPASARHAPARSEDDEVTTALLTLTTVLTAVSVAVFVVSFRRRDPFSAFAGMTVMILAAITAAVYTSVSS